MFVTTSKREIAVGKRIIILNILLVALLAWSLVGCGGKDEAAPVDNTNQTQALVPDSVIQHDEPEAVEPLAEAPLDMAEPAGDPLAEPLVAEPEAISPETAAPAPEASAPQASVPAAGDGIFSLQLGSYSVASFAEEKATDLRKLGHPATVEEAEVGGQLYHRVFIRGLADRQSAEKLGEELHTSLGLSYLIRRK